MKQCAKEHAKTNTGKLVKFSFKYLTTKHEKFNYNSQEAGYFINLIERLRDVCMMEITAFLNTRSQGLRAHPIEWEFTTENEFGLPAEEDLVDTPYQFSLSANEYGRIHGFIIDNRFYIVWLDRKHELYSSKK